MNKIIITILLVLVTLAASAAVPDSIRQNLADFDSVVYMAEHDYAPFKFKVTNKNKKEYNALKKRLVKDLTKGRRTWQDAVCAHPLFSLHLPPSTFSSSPDGATEYRQGQRPCKQLATNK